MPDNSANPNLNQPKPSQSNSPDQEYLYDVIDDFAPHRKGETTADYGQRKFDAYSKKAIAELIPKKPGETNEEYRNRVMGYVSAFYAAHPRRKGDPKGENKDDKRETPSEYRDRIAKLVKKNGDGSHSSEISIKKAEQIIADLKNSFADKEKDDLEKADKELKELEPKMAELAMMYAKNSRLFVGANRAAYNDIKSKYAKTLDDYLEHKRNGVLDQDKHELAEKLESILQELKTEIKQKLNEYSINKADGSRKTQEEIEKEKKRLIDEADSKFKSKFDKEIKERKTNLNASFAKEYCDRTLKLKEATNYKLDNGSKCRKFVSKVLNNKVLKGTLKAAAFAGLAVSGFSIASGLAAGTLAVGLGYTVGNTVFGAATGALGGFITSRRDSKTSRVNDFVTEEQIREKLSKIDITKENTNTKNVTEWLLEKYTEASKQDRSSNRKRTAVAVGLGAAIGGLMSGLHFKKSTERIAHGKRIVGHEPVSYEAANLEAVDVAPNHGFYQVFEQLGGDPANKDQALKIAESIFNKYGANTDLAKGIVAPGNGSIDIFPGKISEWPSVAQSCMKEIADALAAKALIPANKIGGNAIWRPIEKIVIKWIPDAFRYYLTRATAGVGVAAIGGAIGGYSGRSNASKSTPETVNDTEPVPHEVIEEILSIFKHHPQILKEIKSLDNGGNQDPTNTDTTDNTEPVPHEVIERLLDIFKRYPQIRKEMKSIYKRQNHNL